eukprot:g26101.t1
MADGGAPAEPKAPKQAPQPGQMSQSLDEPVRGLEKVDDLKAPTQGTDRGDGGWPHRCIREPHSSVLLSCLGSERPTEPEEKVHHREFFGGVGSFTVLKHEHLSQSTMSGSFTLTSSTGGVTEYKGCFNGNPADDGPTPNGLGVRINPDGSSFAGEWKEPERGTWTCAWHRDRTRRAEEEPGQRVQEHLPASSVRDLLKEGFPHGQGEWKAAAPSCESYVGEWKRGKKHGYGTMKFNNGAPTAQTAHLQDATPEAVRAPRASVSELPKVAAFYRQTIAQDAVATTRRAAVALQHGRKAEVRQNYAQVVKDEEEMERLMARAAEDANEDALMVTQHDAKGHDIDALPYTDDEPETAHDE